MKKLNFTTYNQRSIIRTVPGRWRAQYPNDKDGIQPQLDALNLETCTGDDIDKIIGNQSWTCAFCNLCHEYFHDGVTFDNGDGETEVCKTCVLALAASLGQGGER